MKFQLLKQKSATVAALVSAAVLSGCSYLPDTRINTVDSHKAYTTSQTKQASRQQLELVNVELNLPLEGGQLSSLQQQQIADFIRDQGESYKQRIQVKAKVSHLTQVLKPLDKLLSEQGINVNYRQYLADDAVAENEIVIVSEYFQLTLLPCEVKGKAAFGCATAQNLAVSLPDSGQLIRARKALPADGVRAVKAVSDYQTSESEDTSNNSGFFRR